MFSVWISTPVMFVIYNVHFHMHVFLWQRHMCFTGNEACHERHSLSGLIVQGENTRLRKSGLSKSTKVNIGRETGFLEVTHPCDLTMLKLQSKSYLKDPI